MFINIRSTKYGKLKLISSFKINGTRKTTGRIEMTVDFIVSFNFEIFIVNHRQKKELFVSIFFSY